MNEWPYCHITEAGGFKENLTKEGTFMIGLNGWIEVHWANNKAKTEEEPGT